MCAYSGQDGHGSAPASKNAGTLSHHILVLNAVLYGCLGVNELRHTHTNAHTQGPLQHTLISFVDLTNKNPKARQPLMPL